MCQWDIRNVTQRGRYIAYRRRQTTTWRISAACVGLDWLQSDLFPPPFSAVAVFSQLSIWPLCWWPNSKLILSSPMRQRGRTSGVHSMTNGPASFWSGPPGPGTDTTGRCKHRAGQPLLMQSQLALTDFEEGAELHGSYRLRPVSLWFRRRIGTAERWVRAISVSYKALRELQRHLETWRETQTLVLSKAWVFSPLDFGSWTVERFHWLTRAFTSGVSKMRLTCVRLVMCQVYLERDPRGSPSFLTNAGINKEREVC